MPTARISDSFHPRLVFKPSRRCHSPTDRVSAVVTPSVRRVSDPSFTNNHHRLLVVSSETQLLWFAVTGSRLLIILVSIDQTIQFSVILKLSFSPTLAINFTTWGFKDCQRSLDNGAFGGQSTLTYPLPLHAALTFLPSQSRNSCCVTFLTSSHGYVLSILSSLSIN